MKSKKQNDTGVKTIIYITALVIILTIVFVIAATAQTGYLVVTQQQGAKLQIHKTTSAAAADSIVQAIIPAFSTAATMQSTVYFEQKTQHQYVYIERKTVKRIKPNGQPVLKRESTRNLQPATCN